MEWAIRATNMGAVYSFFSTKKSLSFVVALLVVLAAFPFFFLGGPTPGSTKLFCALWDSGHIIFFVVLAFVFSRIFDVSRWRICLAMLACVFIGGGLIEIIQAQVGRDGNWQDLLNDLAGTSIGLSWFRRANKWVWRARIVSLSACLPLLMSISGELAVRINSFNQFPLLEGFESSIAMYGLKNAQRSSDYHSQGSYSAKVRLGTGAYGGISFTRLTRDWSSYKKFNIDIYNPDSLQLNMMLRVNDVQHDTSGWVDSDRFNKQISLASGWNHLQFSLDEIKQGPATRSMDLTQVSEVILYAKQLPQARVIYIDNIRLE